MNDYISRQAAIDALEGEIAVTGRVNAEAVRGYANLVCDRMKRLPPADVIEVVRCKDCMHAEHWYGDKSRCFLWHEEGIDVFDDGYCSYGKWKDG